MLITLNQIGLLQVFPILTHLYRCRADCKKGRAGRRKLFRNLALDWVQVNFRVKVKTFCNSS